VKSDRHSNRLKQPSQPNATPFARPTPRYQPSSTRRARRPAPKRAQPRRRWRGCLLPLLALASALCLGSILAYGLLLVQPPANTLILGIDRRPDESNVTRSDTILLLHADAGAGRMALLSIPRDLWVTIPGWGQERINAAHLYGELEAPGSGPEWVAETVNYNFGVPVHHVVRLDFDAFREVIDAAGGIEVDVPYPIIDDAYPTPNYGTMRIEIPAGRQHMDGETALQYARSRHSSSDFDRAARQQQILIALANKITQPSNLFRASRVYAAFQNAVESDLGARDLFHLALAWRRAGEEGMEQTVIDETLTAPFLTAQGAAVLLPQWEHINPLIEAQFKP
jgi:LCP family protein required for cell wall assembly